MPSIAILLWFETPANSPARSKQQRNGERYTLLKWAQKNFSNFRIMPPGSGICHQVSANRPDGVVISFAAIARVDMAVEMACFKNHGILNFMLRKIMEG